MRKEMKKNIIAFLVLVLPVAFFFTTINAKEMSGAESKEYVKNDVSEVVSVEADSDVDSLEDYDSKRLLYDRAILEARKEVDETVEKNERKESIGTLFFILSSVAAVSASISITRNFDNLIGGFTFFNRARIASLVFVLNFWLLGHRFLIWMVSLFVLIVFALILRAAPRRKLVNN